MQKNLMQENKSSKYSCVHMKKYANLKCKQHPNIFDCPDATVIYSNKFDEYGIPVRDGGSSYIVINYCPHCGIKLPKSRRDKWFKELEKLGFNEPFEKSIPKKYLTDEWYRKK